MGSVAAVGTSRVQAQPGARVNAPAKPFKPLSVLRAIYSRTHNLPTLHRTVLAAMLPYMNSHGRTHVSQRTLADVTDLSERTVGLLVAELRKGFCERDGKRRELRPPFRFSCKPKHPTPGERKREGRPPLEYTFEFPAPTSGNDRTENPEAASCNGVAEFPEAKSVNSPHEFPEADARVSRSPRPEFPEAASVDLIKASDPDLKMHVATDVAPPLELRPSDGSLRKPKRGRTRASTDDVKRVFEHWRKVLEPVKYTRAVELTDGRRRAIEKGLNAHSAEQLLLAIDGVRRSAWHCGDNDRGEKYIDVQTIFVTPEKIDGHIARASQVTPPRRHANGAFRDVQRGDARDEQTRKAVLEHIANQHAAMPQKTSLF
jgi:hypothetical protein